MCSTASGSHIVVVGASAGGVEALSSLVAGLPKGLQAPVLVVLHIPAGSHSALPHILEEAGALPARHAAHGEPLEDGVIYVAPPDHHLLAVDGAVALSADPPQSWSRPSIDRLFASAAVAHGPGTVAVVLSGMLQDGTVGLRAVLDAGGVGLVQDPLTSAFASMPAHAAPLVAADHVLALEDLAAEVTRLVGTAHLDGAA